MNDVANNTRQKNIVAKETGWMTRYLYPIILLVYPFLNVGKGADITDTSYSLGNYMFMEHMDTAWKYATFLANCVGRVFYFISGGEMLFMQVLCTAVLSAIGLIAYFLLGKYISKHIVFIGELIALGVCWTPTVILYNYLTYFLFVLGAMLMYMGLREENNKLLVAAGVCLGLNVFARTSNLVQVTLIVVVWIDAAKKKGAFWKNTGCCVLGYVLGAIVGILMMLISGGIAGISEMVGWLMSLLTSSDNAGGYSMGGMLDAIIFNYVKQSRWPLLIMLGCLAGVIAFKFAKGALKAFVAGGYVICTAALFVYFFRNGCFTADYFNISCVFGLSASLFVIYLLLFVLICFKKKVAYQDKVLYLMGLIIIIISPLGSNNHLFACINNMFLVAPLFISMINVFVVSLRSGSTYIPVQVMGTTFITVLMVQSVLMHMNFVFRDGSISEPRNYRINADCPMDGMYTNMAHGENISELVKNVSLLKNGEESVLLYGDIPGVSYLLKMPSAISTSWPDLDSFSISKMSDELGSISEDEMPLIVISTNVYDWLYGDAVEADEDKTLNTDKLELARNFINVNGYEETYLSDEFVVLQIPD